MSDDKIEEIRAQHKASDNNFIEYESTWDIHAHRAFLLTEVDRQRAEIERLHRAHDVACEGGDRLHAKNNQLRLEIERLSDVLRRVVVSPSGDSTARVAFVSEGCMVSFPIRPQTTWALEVLIEFDQARRNALEGKP